jgi:hypothetical protein
MEYNTILVLDRKGRQIILYIKGDELTIENIVDVEILESPDIPTSEQPLKVIYSNL